MSEERKCMYCKDQEKCKVFRKMLNCILNEYGLEVVATGK